MRILGDEGRNASGLPRGGEAKKDEIAGRRIWRNVNRSRK
jgi:hypothetical protein